MIGRRVAFNTSIHSHLPARRRNLFSSSHLEPSKPPLSLQHDTAIYPAFTSAFQVSTCPRRSTQLNNRKDVSPRSIPYFVCSRTYQDPTSIGPTIQTCLHHCTISNCRFSHLGISSSARWRYCYDVSFVTRQRRSMRANIGLSQVFPSRRSRYVLAICRDTSDGYIWASLKG